MTRIAILDRADMNAEQARVYDAAKASSGIVGFRIAITRLEGKWKMSQNREMRDREGVASGLRQRAEGDDLTVAGLVVPPVKSSG